MRRSVKNHIIGFSSFAACIILFAIAINPFFRLIDDQPLALRGMATFAYLLTALYIAIRISVPQIVSGDFYNRVEDVAAQNEIPLNLIYAQPPTEVWGFVFDWNRPRFTVSSDGSVVRVLPKEDGAHVSGTRSISSRPPGPSAHAM